MVKSKDILSDFLTHHTLPVCLKLDSIATKSSIISVYGE